MPSLKQLLAKKEADLQREAALREQRREHNKLLSTKYRQLARQRQQKIGALADDAGLCAVSLDVFAEVFTLLAKAGTTDDTIRTWLETASWAVPAGKE